MFIFNVLFINFFLYSVQLDIIRDLPFNVNHEENLNAYENKFIPKGNKFFIRFPSNSNYDIKFILKIPKNINLFPIYSEDFFEFPNDKEIINTNFKNEFTLKKKEDLEYSTYSFDIINNNKNTVTYKVLYFQNNEILNFISFGVYTDKDYNAIFIKDISLGGMAQVDGAMNSNNYFFIARLEKGDKKFEIKVKSKTLNKRESKPYFVSGKAFLYYPQSSDLIDYKEGYPVPVEEDDVSKDGDEEERTYNTSTYDRQFYFFAIEVYTYDDLKYFTIILSVSSTWSNIWKIIVYVIAGIVILIFIFLLFGVTKCHKNFCSCFTNCCIDVCKKSYEKVRKKQEENRDN